MDDFNEVTETELFSSAVDEVEIAVTEGVEYEVYVDAGIVLGAAGNELKFAGYPARFKA